MPTAIRILLLALAVPASIGAAAIQAEDTPYATATGCNTCNTQAYRQGGYPQALDAFAQQLRLAERQEQDGADSEQALNNFALTSFKARQPGRARAWVNLTLDRGYSGKATRHNLEQVTLKVDYPSLQGLAGHYLRYAGQIGWESLQIGPVKGGYRASFALIYIGNPEKLMEYGPAAIDELSGRLEGQGALYQLRSEGLGTSYSLLMWQEGTDLRVVENPGGDYQGYDGMSTAAVGNWVKISNQARDGWNFSTGCSSGAAHGKSTQRPADRPKSTTRSTPVIASA